LIKRIHAEKFVNPKKVQSVAPSNNQWSVILEIHNEPFDDLRHAHLWAHERPFSD